MFSYGSGLASAMYSLRVTTDSAPKSRLSVLAQSLSDIPARLKARKTVPPAEFERIMKLREETHHLAPYTPVGSTAELFPGTYYLKGVDEKYRRSYERVAVGEREVFPTLQSPLRESVANGTS